jgi:hypothetical protein
MKRKSLPPVLKAILILFYAFTLYAAVIVLWLLLGRAAGMPAPGGEQQIPYAAAVLFLMLGIMFAVAAEGIRRRKSWSRIAGGALGVLIALDAASKFIYGAYLYAVLGAIIGIFIAWYMFAKKEF